MRGEFNAAPVFYIVVSCIVFARYDACGRCDAHANYYCGPLQRINHIFTRSRRESAVANGEFVAHGLNEVTNGYVHIHFQIA